MIRKFDIQMAHQELEDSNRYSLIVGSEEVAWVTTADKPTTAQAFHYLIALAAEAGKPE